MSKNKIAYFQGGGGVNEPSPGKKKYKSDPAIVMQTRFKEPFYHNYDTYNIPGFEHIGPGAGWHHMQDYKSVQEFLEAKRKKLLDKYVTDDSWQLDDGTRTKKNPDIKARVAILNRIIKMADDENNGPNFDYGHGAYDAMNDGNKMKSITDFKRTSPGVLFSDDNADYTLPPKEHGTSIYDWKNSIYQGKPKAPKKHDSNDIDFPTDIQREETSETGPIIGDSESFEFPQALGPAVDAAPNDGIMPGSVGLGDFESAPYAAQIGGYLDRYTPQKDFEGKGPDQLDFGRDYTEDVEFPGSLNEDDLEKLMNKYLTPAESDLFGLPDGIDPISDLDAENTVNNEQTYSGKSDIGTRPFEDKWNI